MTDLLDAAEREEKELERKLAAVRALMAAYRGQGAAQPSPATPPSLTPRTYVRASDTQELVEKARAYLQQAGVRMSAKPLLEQIAPERAAAGISAVNAFSSALSRSPLFSGARGKGYGLAEWGEAEVAPPTTPGSSTPTDEVNDAPM